MIKEIKIAPNLDEVVIEGDCVITRFNGLQFTWKIDYIYKWNPKYLRNLLMHAIAFSSKEHQIRNFLDSNVEGELKVERL